MPTVQRLITLLLDEVDFLSAQLHAGLYCITHGWHAITGSPFVQAIKWPSLDPRGYLGRKAKSSLDALCVVASLANITCKQTQSLSTPTFLPSVN